MNTSRRDFLTFRNLKPVTNTPSPLKKMGRTRRNSDLDNRQQAARFLTQATFGPTMAEIDHVTAVGIEAWLDEQFNMPRTETLRYMWEKIDPVYRIEDEPLLSYEPFRWAWWQAVMRNQDQLRQRVAMALSEIMVISTKTDSLLDVSPAVGSYYDVLLKHAFGNFRDLLYDVAVHPAMGYYLSHAGNRKADPSINRYPDENFAREIMQLFSIGLFELNNDGSRKKDRNGEDIPTYDNDDIKEFAKIFTGLNYTVAEFWEEEDIDVNTDDGFSRTEMNWENGEYPMVMYDQFHSQGEKKLLNGFVVPSGQSGLKDVQDAIGNLFDHPNVGPFIGRLLIQRLVTSNPSAGYIGRVASAFNDNGRGERGDMQAVVRAILLDNEARDLSQINDPTHGMLREPFVRYVQLCRGLEVRNKAGEDLFYNSAHEIEVQLGQYPFASPSVFNFFSPDYRPLGPLSEANLTAPEFQITTSVTTTQLFNFFEWLIFDDYFMEVPEGLDEDDLAEAAEDDFQPRMPTISDVVLHTAPFEAIEGDVDALVGRLELLFAYGSFSTRMGQIIKTAVTDLYNNDPEEWMEVVRFAILMVITSPETAVLK